MLTIAHVCTVPFSALKPILTPESGESDDKKDKVDCKNPTRTSQRVRTQKTCSRALCGELLRRFSKWQRECHANISERKKIPCKPKTADYFHEILFCYSEAYLMHQMPSMKTLWLEFDGCEGRKGKIKCKPITVDHLEMLFYHSETYQHHSVNVTER